MSITAVVALICALIPVSSASAACSGASARPGKAPPATIRHATLCLLNEKRHARGLRRLRESRQLTAAAGGYAALMVRERFFDHVSPAGSTLLTRVRGSGYLAGIGTFFAAENIAWASGRAATPRGMVRQWMNSPPHRENILNGRLRDIGIGAATGAPNGSSSGGTYVTDFGTRG